MSWDSFSNLDVASELGYLGLWCRLEIKISIKASLIIFKSPNVIPDSSNSIGYRTIQCYLADFQEMGEWRDNKINEILD